MKGCSLSDEYITKEFLENEKLIYYVMRNVLHLSDKWFYSYYSFEDVASVGRMGLLDGIKFFNENKGVKKTTYYCTCIKNRIKRDCIYVENYECRKSNKNNVSLNKKITVDGINSIELIDLYHNKDDYELSLKISYYRSTLNNLIENGYFNEREVLIINRYLKGFTYREIGKELGVTHQRVEQLFKEIKRRLAIFKV